MFQDTERAARKEAREAEEVVENVTEPGSIPVEGDQEDVANPSGSESDLHSDQQPDSDIGVDREATQTGHGRDVTDSPFVSPPPPVLTQGGDFALPLFSPKKSGRRSGSIHSSSSGHSNISQNAGFLVTPSRVRQRSGMDVRHSPAPRFSISSPASSSGDICHAADHTFLSYIQSQSPSKVKDSKSKKKKRKLVDGF